MDDDWADSEDFFDDGDETGDDDPGFWLEENATHLVWEDSEG